MSALTQLQINFLTTLQQNRAPVAIYLKNGIKLKGIIKSFDEDSIMLSDPNPQLIQTSAVSTVAPLINFQTFSMED